MTEAPWYEEEGMPPPGVECEGCGMVAWDLPAEFLQNNMWEQFFELGEDGWLCRGCLK